MYRVTIGETKEGDLAEEDIGKGAVFIVEVKRSVSSVFRTTRETKEKESMGYRLGSWLE